MVLPANSVGNFSHMAKNIEVDAHGNIWVQHMRKGLYRLRLDEELEAGDGPETV